MSGNLERCSRSLLVCERSNFKKEKSRHDIHVSKHYFNYKVSVVIPECTSLPAGISGVIQNFNRHFRAQDLPLFKLLEEDFIENVVRKGHFYALSCSSRIDEDNVIAFLPSGLLILSVDKDTYEQLGLEGRPSQYNPQKPQRYVVTVDLTDKRMSADAKRYQRVMMSLREWMPITCDWLMSVKTNGQDCVSLQTLLSQYSIKECKPLLQTQLFREFPCPSLQSTLSHGHEACDENELLEWLGAINLGISCDNEASSFLSTYDGPEARSIMDHGLLCTITGFLIPEDIQSLLHELRHYFDQPKRSPWLSMTVHGFADSPVSWGTTEHGFLRGGENFYNFVCFQNQDYWLQMGTGSHDGCPP